VAIEINRTNKLNGECIMIFAGNILEYFNSLKNRLDRFRLKVMVGQIGKESMIHEGVMLVGCPENIKIGTNINIYHRSVLAVGRIGYVEVGDYSHLGVNVYLNATEGRIIIGKGVAIAPFVQIYSYSNSIESGKKIIESHTVRDVIIEDDVLIGSSVTILPGVVIGKGAVIGAGAIVNKNVEPYTIVAGVPAKKINDRK